VNCVFSEIAGGRAPAHFIEETNNCIAKSPLDIEVDGHRLILPKNHYNGIIDIPSDILANHMDFVK
jgi:diadenosine tetraphosphate (Ap4A) HIT family hydrolase